MTDAHRCDNCGEFAEGEAEVRAALRLVVDDQGPLAAMMGADADVNPEVGLDFCSVDCLQAYDLNDERERLLSEVGKKDQLLNGGESA